MVNDAVKNTLYDNLVNKVNAIDTEVPITSGLTTKTQYDSEKQGLEKKKLKMMTKGCLVG